MKRFAALLLALLIFTTPALAFDDGIIAGTSLTTTYASIYTVPVGVYEVIVYNTTDVDIVLSWDTTSGGLQFPAGHKEKINLCKYGLGNREHTLTVYVKEVTDGGSGSVIVGGAQ